MALWEIVKPLLAGETRDTCTATILMVAHGKCSGKSSSPLLVSESLTSYNHYSTDN